MMTNKQTSQNPMDPNQMMSLKHWGATPKGEHVDAMHSERFVECGWGRLIFGQTYNNPENLAQELLNEQEDQRDVALYMRDPNIVLSYAPQRLFLDPSLTFRLPLETFYETSSKNNPLLKIRPASGLKDEEAINRLYKTHNMVPFHAGFLGHCKNSEHLIILVAVERTSESIVGVVIGVDHKLAINDPDNGSSLWALAVDAQSPIPRVGMDLVEALASLFKKRKRAFMDLSVMHNNTQAIALYKKIGFEQIPVYCIKKKNAINEPLFIGPESESALNIYAKIIIDEAKRRGIAVDVQDAEHSFFSLSLGGTTISCRESLSDYTSAVAMSRCDDKAVSRKYLVGGGLKMPDQITVQGTEDVQRFLKTHQRVVVKPAQGEQGQGIAVDLRVREDIDDAIQNAQRICGRVLLEEFVEGEDLRIIVIDGAMVAAAVRRPPIVVGDGQRSIKSLIEKQSRRRQAATQGESTIPLDEETLRTVRATGYCLDTVLEKGLELKVRKTANLHTGGTIHDVTEQVHPRVEQAAVEAARLLDIPVVGLDFLVPDLSGSDYWIVEANERPGLANHEPQPTAERFIDFLFPQTKPVKWQEQTSVP